MMKYDFDQIYEAKNNSRADSKYGHFHSDYNYVHILIRELLWQNPAVYKLVPFILKVVLWLIFMAFYVRVCCEDLHWQSLWRIQRVRHYCSRAWVHPWMSPLVYNEGNPNDKLIILLLINWFHR